MERSHTKPEQQRSKEHSAAPPLLSGSDGQWGGRAWVAGGRPCELQSKPHKNTRSDKGSKQYPAV